MVAQAMEQQVLCVRRATLQERLGGIPLGLTVDQEALTAFQEAVRSTGEFRPRPALEEDPTYLQVIVQGLVTDGASVLALFRKSREPQTDRFVETRHNAKIALSSGGHVEPVEANSGDVLRAALERELSEELVFTPVPPRSALLPLGLVCNAAPDASLFHRVHMGMVFLVPVPGAVHLPEGSNEFEHVELAGRDRLRELLPRMEEWGQILADAILDGRLSLDIPETVVAKKRR